MAYIQQFMAISMIYGDNDYWLVVSNMTFIFHVIWDVILPIDFHIFQRGGSTTNQIIISLMWVK
jgi:hypothetical protein